MDRSPSTPTTTSDQPSSWPDQRSATGGPATRGPQPSRLGEALRNLVPGRGEAVTAGPVFSTGGGGFRSGNRPEPPARGEAGGRGSGPLSSGARGGSGGPRLPSGGGGGGGGTPRPERYWTDYLRIALPIIGLLLMLSVFIFWVGNIIDGNNDGEDTAGTEVAISTTTPDPAAAAPTATVPAAAQSAAPSTDGAAESPAESPAETASEAPAGEPTTEAGDEATEPAADDAAAEPTDEVPPDEATEAAPGADGGFAEGDAVSVTQDGVALRPGATTEGDPIVRLNSGTEVTVLSGPESGGDFEWYEVETADGETGWIAADFLEAVAG